ncbi:MAG: helix-turn-helix domain-containing protein [Neisseriaceae bacterium]|nr:helix-turn-helix domain-containing protein [Neisseriaceae bacterium]
MTNDSLESNNTEQEPVNISVGEQLRLARINQNLSINDISSRLKWPISKISSIEADDYEHLGGLTFMRGLVRSYAKLLDLDVEAILSQLAFQLGHSTQFEQTNPLTNAHPKQEQKSHYYGLFFFLLTLTLLATFLWIYGHRTQSTKALTTQTTPLIQKEEHNHSTFIVTSEPIVSEVIASQAMMNPSNNKNSRLRLILVKPSYFTLIDAQGKKLHSGLLPAEVAAEFEGLAPFQITIGAATDAQLFLNDVEVPLADKIKGGVARLNLGK